MELQFLIAQCILLITWCISAAWGYVEYPGPMHRPTKGEIWPRPQKQVRSSNFHVVIPSELSFIIAGESCEILEEAISRYGNEIAKVTRNRGKRVREVMSDLDRRKIKEEHINNANYGGRMERVVVNLTKPCEQTPHLDMDEAYELEVLSEDVSGLAKLTSSSIWGILRGLESLFQSMYFMSDDIAYLQINVTHIEDYPRFPHRGILLDTSRHYLSTHIIRQVLEGLAINKLNVLHWHIVDDQSFPYVSSKFPTLSEKGAYNRYMVYTFADIINIILYGKMRGIRVIPEFDTPGHTRSWGEAFPNLLAQCYDSSGNLQPGALGPIDPSKEETYTFMKELLTELSMIFYDKYIHLGGDEVGFECWKNNPGITAFMTAHNITDYRELEDIYIQRIAQIVDDLKLQSIVWQEVFENNVRIPNSTVVQLWYGNIATALYKSTLAGYKTLLSTCWYLDHLSTGGDWTKYYECDPHNFEGTEEQKKLVIGGEACMWAEVVDNTNALTRIFPRASAVAEKLWSSKDQSGPISNELKSRLEEHTCRMNLRGIPAQPPSGPGYCF